MEEYSLHGEWELREEPISTGVSQFGRVAEAKDGWISARVPGDVHVDLLAAGRIPEPLVGLNSFKTEWIEDRSWWYRKRFTTCQGWLDADVVELQLDGLDAMAEIFLNGVHLGKHISTFRPFVMDVKDVLKDEGEENVLLIRLTSGLEHFSREDISSVEPFVSAEAVGGRGDKRRVYVRKPQYSFGWDWNPRVPTCGITRDARIRPLDTAVIRDVHVTTKLGDENSAHLDATITVESLDWIGTQDGTVYLEITGEDGRSTKVSRQVFLRSGYNYVDLSVNLDEPRLWWPNGMGEQHRYEVKVSAEISGKEISYPVFKYGARTVALDQTKLDDDGRLFAIIVNGKRVYCRGANWIPADSIYGRVSDRKYECLIEEAAGANFTMLRIWGGGLYEFDCFYDYCDREGILIWHDFMFACGAYPDHEEWFVDEVKKEVDYQTTRLRNHACIALWSGNNENSWGFLDWWQKQTKGGARIYNEVIPETVQRNCPDIPYWNGSPYGGASPNCAGIGDRHHWHDCMMNPGMEKRITPEEYDKVDPRFISEYGYVGPCCKESTLTYLDGHPFDRNGEAWQHHNNTFEKNTVVAGIKKHYTDPERMNDEEYLLYAGLCQGMMYEYSLDSFRSRRNCSGGLFWMYNDCWGEVGWTIIDYYLNRKISYNFVRRANAPVRLIMRERGGQIEITLANDSNDRVAGALEFGYMSFDGSRQDVQTVDVNVGPFERAVVHAFERGDHDLTAGCLFARLPGRGDVFPAIFRTTEFRNLKVGDPGLSVCGLELTSGGGRFRVRAEGFAHAVHFNLPVRYRLSDEYFDLLPGEERIITVTGEGLSQDMIEAEAVRVD